MGDARNVLVAGAGGGFDVFSGLPLYLALRAEGRNVHLANLSFSNLEGEKRSHALYRVTADLKIEDGRYFPEHYLCRFLRSKGIEAPVWGFERTGVAPIAEAYRILKEELRLDAVLLVDGGTDSLMRGDESGLGTPQEDVASMVAADALGIERTFLLCLGFGVDDYHGVSHVDVLRAVQDLSEHYLGAWALTPAMEEARAMAAAVEYAHSRQPDYPSIVCSSILSALEGGFGDVHRTERTAGSRLFINPLMCFYWMFRLRGVVGRLLYADRVRNSTTYTELNEGIRAFRREIVPRPKTSMPL
ncbi:MAG TPA: DUF1152 domain-containing protein [Planctomycetota bacterium]